MNWGKLINGAITAAITGGAAVLIQTQLDPNRMDFKRAGMSFLGGAVIGVVNWMRTSPWQEKCKEDSLEQSHGLNNR